MTRAPLLLDTNILVALLRGKGVVHEAVVATYELSTTSFGPESLVCTISLGELLALVTADRDFDHLDGIHVCRDFVDPATGVISPSSGWLQ